MSVPPPLLLRRAIQEDIHARGFDTSQGDAMERLTSLCLAWYRQALENGRMVFVANGGSDPPELKGLLVLAEAAEPAPPGTTEWWPK